MALSGQPNDFTAQDMITQIDQAISAIVLGGQSYTIGSRSLTRANLKELLELKRILATEASTEDPESLSGFYVARFEGR